MRAQDCNIQGRKDLIHWVGVGGGERGLYLATSQREQQDMCTSHLNELKMKTFFPKHSVLKHIWCFHITGSEHEIHPEEQSENVRGQHLIKIKTDSS